MGNKRYQEYVYNTVFFALTAYPSPNHGETDEGDPVVIYVFFRYFRTACTTIEQATHIIWLSTQLKCDQP